MRFEPDAILIDGGDKGDGHVEQTRGKRNYSFECTISWIAVTESVCSAC